MVAKKKTPVMTSGAESMGLPSPRKMPDMFVPHMLHKMKTPKATDALFRTDVNPLVLWEAYLFGLPAHLMQEHNCRCCKQFIERYREPLKGVRDESQVAAGVMLDAGSCKFALKVVLKGGVTTEVTIDRWE